MPSGSKDKYSPDPNALLESAVKSVVGATSFTGAIKEASQQDKDKISRILRTDVDEWRAKFASRLREVGDEILELIWQKRNLIKPDNLAFTLATLTDKGLALEGRSQLTNAAVNVQINNYGTMTKDALLASLSPLQNIPGHNPNTPQPSLHHQEPVLPSVPIEVNVSTSPSTHSHAGLNTATHKQCDTGMDLVTGTGRNMDRELVPLTEDVKKSSLYTT